MRIVITFAFTLALVASLVSSPAAQADESPVGIRAPAVSSSITAFPGGITRLSGATRYETAVAVSQRFAPGVTAVFVATGADFPDALSASAAAAALGGPLLLTRTSTLPTAVATEIRRLKPQHIYVVGGSSVVSAGVVTSLSQVAATTRLGGDDRYSTADKVIEVGFTAADHAIIATGRTFPDALAATGAAGARHAPVFLVDGAKPTVPRAVLDLLSRLGVRSISITGGAAVVSSGIQTQLAGAGFDVSRYGGATRYETAALVNAAYFPPASTSNVFLATGADFPDALAAGALAGQLGAPLDLTRRSCIDLSTNDAITALGATSTIVMGGTAVLTQAAALNTRCVYPTTSEPLADWSVSGWTLPADVSAPYSDRPPVNVYDPSIKLDSTGLVIYKRVDTGARADHPVAYAQYGISALLEYQRTGNRVWLDRALRQADRLVAIHTERAGAWWFPYTFPWTYYQRTLTAPWWSGMAQGEALSLFVRLANETGDPKWDTAANHTWSSFLQSHSATAPWASLSIDHHLYFEEYAGNQPPLLVLNGHIFALFGIYDYWRRTGDPTAEKFVDGAATTVLQRMLPAVRVEHGVSYYCVQADYCQVPGWQNATYHVIHSWQLDTLARLTGDSRFTTWAATLRSDWAPASPFARALPDGTNSVPTPLPSPIAPDLGTW